MHNHITDKNRKCENGEMKKNRGKIISNRRLPVKVNAIIGDTAPEAKGRFRFRGWILS